MRWWWLSIETVAVVVPPLIAFMVGTGEPETFWSNLAIITGSQAAATLVVAVLFASRFKAITQSIGIDAAVSIHKVLGSSAVLFILFHLISVVADYPINVWLVDVFQAPARSLAGLSALVILLLMLLFANKEKQRYEWWRWSHRAGAILAISLIVWHIVGLNQLVNSVPWLLFFTALLLSIMALLVSRWIRSRKHKKYTVADIREESPTVSTITLTPTTSSGIKFTAGQFVWVRLSRNIWAEDHPFTIASSEYEHDLRITFRHSGDWTKNSLATLTIGKTVWVDGPHGAMNLSRVPASSGIALVGVGVGLTPVMSVLRTLTYENTQQSIFVFISPNEELFLEELANLDEQFTNVSVFLTVQRPINKHIFSKHMDELQDWYFLVCGQASMVVSCQEVLQDLNVPESHILTEQFEII